MNLGLSKGYQRLGKEVQDGYVEWFEEGQTKQGNSEGEFKEDVQGKTR